MIDSKMHYLFFMKFTFIDRIRDIIMREILSALIEKNDVLYIWNNGFSDRLP